MNSYVLGTDGRLINVPPSHDVQKQRVASDMDRAFAVFSGEVVRDDHVTVTLQVHQAWKGPLGTSVTLPTGARWTDETHTMLTGSSCDFGFGLGRRYLVYAYGESVETMRPAGSCGPSVPLESADSTIKLLDEIVADRR